jgi:hypothetical protein
VVSVYVYGVTRAGLAAPPGTRGIGDPPARVRTPAYGGLAAVVSAAPDRLRPRRRDLQAHQDVQLAFAGVGPLLPTRFGAVAEDEDAVLARLRSDAEGYAAALDRVEGRFEMNLKASPVEDGVAALVRTDPQVRRLRQESRRRPGYDTSVRLGEAVVAGLRRQALAAAREVAEALTELADDVRPGDEVPGCVLNVSFLVHADRVGGCRAVVDDLGAQLADRAELRLAGPLPCYSFCGPTAPAGV